MSRVPQIRFEKYNNEWKKKMFKKGFFGLQNNSFSRDELGFDDEIIMDIHYGDILTKFGEYIDVSETKLPYIKDPVKAEKYRNSFLQDGDIVIADTAEDNAAGKTVEIQDSNNLSILAGLHTMPFRPRNKYGKYYLGYYMNSFAYHNQLLPLMQGIKVYSISKTAIQDTFISYPESVEEQTEIGLWFARLDNSISLYKKQSERLLKTKSAMIEKMFPKEGKKKPEIRFDGFMGDWTNYKCKDVLVERSILHPQSEKYPLVSFTVENGVTPKTERYEREQLVRGEKKAKNYKETRLDDIVYNPANLKFGAISRNKLGNAVFSPIYVTYEVDDTLALPSFIELVVTRDSFIKEALQYQQGTVYERMAVNPEDFGDLDILVPSKEEQLQIGTFFTNLDNLINLYQRKIKTMESIKKALLSRMFV